MINIGSFHLPLYSLPLIPIAVVVALSIAHWCVLLYRWSKKLAIGIAIAEVIAVAMWLLPSEEWYWIPFSPIVVAMALSVAYWLQPLWKRLGTMITRKNFAFC